MSDLKDFEIEIIATSRHLYRLRGRSAEEVVGVAEAMLTEDEEPGQILDTQIEASDAYPSEDVISGDDIEFDSEAFFS